MINAVPSNKNKSSQISSKITNFEHQISLGNVTLYRKNMYPLQPEYFLTFLIYITVVLKCILQRFGFPYGISYGYHSVFPTKTNPSISSKITIFWTKDETGNCGYMW